MASNQKCRCYYLFNACGYVCRYILTATFLSENASPSAENGPRNCIGRHSSGPCCWRRRDLFKDILAEKHIFELWPEIRSFEPSNEQLWSEIWPFEPSNTTVWRRAYSRWERIESRAAIDYMWLRVHSSYYFSWNNFVSAKRTGMYGNVEKNCSRILGALLGHIEERQYAIFAIFCNSFLFFPF